MERFTQCMITWYILLLMIVSN